MWVYDRDTLQFLAVNDAAVRSYGYSRDEFLQMSIGQIRPPDDAAALQEVLAGLGEGDHREVRTWHVKRDGTRIAVEIASEPLEFAGRPARLVVAQDLTGRLAAEKALLDSEDRFRSIVERHDDPMGISAEGIHVECNQAYLTLFGYCSADQVRGKPVLDLIAPSARPQVQHYLEARQAGRDAPTSYETRGLRAEGTEFDLEVRVSSFVRGAEQLWLVTCRDVSERNRAIEERALRQHAVQRFQNRLRQLHEASIELSRTESLDDLCRSAVELGRDRLGFDRLSLWLAATDPDVLSGTYGTDEVGGTRPEHHQQMQSSEAQRRELFREGRVVVAPEWPLMDDHGREVGRGWHAMAALWDGERIIGVLNADNLLNHQPLQEHEPELLMLYGAAVGHLCGRVHTQELLRQREERFRALIENSADAVAVVAPNGRILYGSPAAHRMLGYSSENFVGRNALRLMHPDDRLAARRYFVQCYRNPGVQIHGTTRMRHQDGSWRLMEGVLNNQLANRAVQGIVINYRDVTDRRQLEEQFQQAQRMEAVGRLAGGIAHDFNNLLTAIMGYSELARMQLPPDDAVQSDLLRVEQAAGLAANLTRQLLAFARRQVIEPLVIQLGEAVHNLETMLRRIIGEDVELQVLLAEDVWPVKADSAQVEQILVNLAVNARDAMPHGGTLRIEVANVRAGERGTVLDPDIPEGEYALLMVSDTGQGMTSEVRARAFDPFFTTKEPGKGTGLGLATTHGIVRQHGGHIRLSSAPGQGASFRVYLPRTTEAVDGPAPLRPRRGAPRGDETVLLVEDEPLVRQYAAQALRAHGFTVLEAAGGDEALRAARQWEERLDILVTDVVMPHMRGDALAAILTGMRPGLKVLYTSGYTDSAVVPNEVADGGAAFLAKPYVPATLAEKVREVLDRAG